MTRRWADKDRTLFDGSLVICSLMEHYAAPIAWSPEYFKYPVVNNSSAFADYTKLVRYYNSKSCLSWWFDYFSFWYFVHNRRINFWNRLVSIYVIGLSFVLLFTPIKKQKDTFSHPNYYFFWALALLAVAGTFTNYLCKTSLTGEKKKKQCKGRKFDVSSQM